MQCWPVRPLNSNPIFQAPGSLTCDPPDWALRALSANLYWSVSADWRAKATISTSLSSWRAPHVLVAKSYCQLPVTILNMYKVTPLYRPLYFKGGIDNKQLALS